MKKALLAVGAFTAISASTVTGIGIASAATESTSSDPASSMVAKIANRFKLDKTEVQAVFDEQHAAMQEEREQKMKTKLAEAVANGDLTQAQADKITAKLAELEKSREANKDKTVAERRTTMKAQMDELQTWAKEHDIDMQYLHTGGHGPREHRHINDTDSSAESSS